MDRGPRCRRSVDHDAGGDNVWIRLQVGSVVESLGPRPSRLDKRLASVVSTRLAEAHFNTMVKLKSSQNGTAPFRSSLLQKRVDPFRRLPQLRQCTMYIVPSISNACQSSFGGWVESSQVELKASGRVHSSARPPTLPWLVLRRHGPSHSFPAFLVRYATRGPTSSSPSFFC